MKNFFLIVFLFFGLYNLSYASITLDPSGEVEAGSPLIISCDGIEVDMFTSKGVYYGDALCSSSTTMDNVNNYVFVECSSNGCGNTLAEARSSEFYLSEVFLKVLPSELTTGSIPKSIFYSRDPETEKSTASNLVAMVGDATGTTTETFGGILATIGGIIAGFGVILYIKSIIDEAKDKKTKNDRL